MTIEISLITEIVSPLLSWVWKCEIVKYVGCELHQTDIDIIQSRAELYYVVSTDGMGGKDRRQLNNPRNTAVLCSNSIAAADNHTVTLTWSPEGQVLKTEYF